MHSRMPIPPPPRDSRGATFLLGVITVTVMAGLLVLLAAAPALIWGASYWTGFWGGAMLTLFLTAKVRVKVPEGDN